MRQLFISYLKKLILFPTEQSEEFLSFYQLMHPDVEDANPYPNSHKFLNLHRMFSKKFKDVDHAMKDNFNSGSPRFLKFVKQDLYNFAKTENGVSKSNFGYVRLYVEPVLAQKPKWADLWLVYGDSISQDLCQDEKLRLNILERSLKYCNTDERLWIAYFEELERQEFQNKTIQDILLIFQSSLDQ